MNPQTDPPQPADVARVIADVLADDDPATDPWWQAGIDDALEE